MKYLFIIIFSIFLNLAYANELPTEDEIYQQLVPYEKSRGLTIKKIAFPPCPEDKSEVQDSCQGKITHDDGSTYEGELKAGMPNGQGIYIFINGDKYVGEFKDGKYYGQGTYTFADGTTYVGEYKDSVPNGQGTHTYLDGSKYVGEYKNNKYHGQGTFTFSNGEKYVGEHKNNKYHGQGTYTYLDGSKYVGKYKNNKYHGQGTYIFASGTKYIGEYKDDKRHGQGTETRANGDKYVGEWKEGKQHGQGTLILISGTKYVGEWKDGMPNGQGTQTLINGDKYVGEWKEGKEHGQGTLILINGDKHVGEWKAGMPHGQATETYANGDKYVGEYKAGKRHKHKRHGQGTFIFTSGAKYVGKWKDGKREGQGTFTFSNGDKYVGEWKGNKRHGQGTYSFNNGDVKVGEWKNGKLLANDQSIEEDASPAPKDVNKTWKYKAWSIDANRKSDFLRASTNGEVVHGHTFGIMKAKNNCNDNILYLSLSSNKKDLNILKGKKIPIEIKVDEKIYKFNLAINTIKKVPIRRMQDIGKSDAPTISLLLFETLSLDESFISDLKKGDVLNLKILDGKDFSKKFDITKEKFSLKGFVTNYTKLTESCKDINQLLIPPPKIEPENKIINQYEVDNLITDHSKCNNEKIEQFLKTSPTKTFTFHNNYLYWGLGHDGQDQYEDIHVTNICNPLDPLVVTSISGTASQVHSMYADDKYLYVDSSAYDAELDQSDNSFKIIDTKEFKLVSKIEKKSAINYFAINGDKLYLSEGKTVKIYNISNKKNPILENKFTAHYKKYDIEDIVVDYKYIYLTGNSHLKIYDKKTFKLLSNTEFEHRTTNIIMKNNKAIISGWNQQGEKFFSNVHLNDRKKIDVLKKIKTKQEFMRKINQDTVVYGHPPDVKILDIDTIFGSADISPKAKDWKTKNQWFGLDKEMTDASLAIHDILVNEGLNPDTDEYYCLIDKSMIEQFPEYFKKNKSSSTFTCGPDIKTEDKTGKSQEALESYIVQIHKVISGQMQYPRIAQMRGWEGEVILNLEIDGQGTLIKSSIKQSSDFKILDEEAIAIVKRASPFPKPSKELESVIFNVIVPITFRLTKAESNLDWLF